MKKLATVFVLFAFLVTPSVSSAATLEELREQLRQLLEQIASLEVRATPEDTITVDAGDFLTPSNTSTEFRVLVPNGGEEWEVGTMNTITWAPYGYNPDINPPSDVVAYLEKKVGNRYRVVGKVVPSGKASIHWETDIDTYGNYPAPGKYYIRIENTKTKKSDRSDKPFTLTPRSVDVKVNRSNGPVELAYGDLITVSWTTRGSFEKCSAYGVSKEQFGNSTYLGDLPTKGSLKLYYNEPYSGSVSMYCEKEGGNMTRWDSVRVDMTSEDPEDPAPEAELTLGAPNGGEKIDPSKKMEITFGQTGLKMLSVALYKNDQWKHWIVKDKVLSGDGKDSVTWVPSSALEGLGEGDNAGAIFKIYITGQKSDQGYLDDKSDKPFSFTGVATVPGTIAADLKANGSDGPLYVKDAEKLSVVWKSTGADRCQIGNVRTSPTGPITTLYNLQTSGTRDLYAVGPGLASISSMDSFISLGCYRGQGAEQMPTQTNSAVDLIAIKASAGTVFPTCELTANKTTITPGESITLTWTSKNTDYAILPGGDKGRPSGSETYTPEATKTYTYQFYGAGGRTACSKTIVVQGNTTPVVPTPTISFRASPTTVQAKGKATLSWEAKNATHCVTNGETVGTTGTKVVYPTNTTTYSLWCVNDPGTGKDGPSATANATVWVAYHIETSPSGGGGGGEKSLLQQASALEGLRSAKEQVMALLERVQALLIP